MTTRILNRRVTIWLSEEDLARLNRLVRLMATRADHWPSRSAVVRELIRRAR